MGYRASRKANLSPFPPFTSPNRNYYNVFIRRGLFYNTRNMMLLRLDLFPWSVVYVRPFHIDMYFPSFLEFAQELNVQQSLVQLGLTASLIGLAAGQLIVGIISDAMRRRKPIVLFIKLLFCVHLHLNIILVIVLGENIDE